MPRVSEHTYLRTHRLSGQLLGFRLDPGEARLREQAAGSKAGRAAQTLVKEGSLRITQVALRKGTPLRSHQVAGAVSIQMRRGRLRLTMADSAVDLGPGELVVLAAGVTHAAIALSDCALLLTMAIE